MHHKPRPCPSSRPASQSRAPTLRHTHRSRSCLIPAQGPASQHKATPPHFQRRWSYLPAKVPIPCLSHAHTSQLTLRQTHRLQPCFSAPPQASAPPSRLVPVPWTHPHTSAPPPSARPRPDTATDWALPASSIARMQPRQRLSSAFQYRSQFEPHLPALTLGPVPNPLTGLSQSSKILPPARNRGPSPFPPAPGLWIPTPASDHRPQPRLGASCPLCSTRP